MPQFTIAEAKAQLSRLVSQALNGEEVILAEENKPLVKLVPMRRAARRRRPGSAKGLLTMSKDFGALLEDMKRYGEQ